LLIALGAIFPYKVYANTTNPFAAQDRNYKEQLLMTKSTYSEVKLSIQPNKSKVLGVNAENRYMVKFGNDVSLEQISHLITGYSYKIIGESSHRIFRIEINDIETFKVISKSIVQSIELDSKTKLSAIPNDPNLPSQWSIKALSLPNAWDITKGSDSKYVAVIDSGVSRYHVDLSNNQVRAGWDMLSNNYVYEDTVGHGTEVTGVIAATTNNNIGVSGTCWNVAIVPIAVVYYDGTIYTSDIVNAIYLAADLGCKVINLSLGGPLYSASEDAAVQYATSKGCIVVAAAGNDSNSTIEYPASLDNVISVGSINKYLSHSYFSSYNSYVDVCAPGEDILTTTYDNYYSYAAGTSFSSPYVAGIASLAATVVPGITATQFREAIVASSMDLGSIGWDNYYGYGLINAEKLLKYVTQGVFVPVTNVSLNKTNLMINIGAHDSLSATIAPITATNKDVTWNSSNTAIATVNSNGIVVGVSPGLAVITLTTVDGNKTATCTVTVAPQTGDAVSVSYQGHVQDIGWQNWVSDGQDAGTEGAGLRVEALKIKLVNAPVGASIKYQAHVQNVGWQDWVSDGQEAGTDGKSLRVEAIKICLENMPGYSVQYQAYVQNVGWQDWVSDGQEAGTEGLSLRIDAMKIRIVKVSDNSTIGIQYQGHVQDLGWQDLVSNGQITGTVGKRLRVEAFKINLVDAPVGASIKYQGHVQNVGWQDWVSNGEVAGTEGLGLRVEAVKITLGNMPGYSVQYQAHVQNIGWQDWVSDGQEAGTDGKSLRIEAIRIRIVKN